MKGIMVGRANDGTTAFVVRNQEDYVRNVVCNTKHRCWMCDLGFLRDDLANLACDGRGSGRGSGFAIHPKVNERVHSMMGSRGFRRRRDALAARDAALE